MVMYKNYISYLNQRQTATAIWAGTFFVFYNNLGRQLVRQGQFYFVLVCFVLFWCYSCVYNTSKTIVFTDSVNYHWIFLSGSCQHPTRSCVFYLLQLQFLHLHSIYKDIKSGHLVLYYPDF